MHNTYGQRKSEINVGLNHARGNGVYKYQLIISPWIERATPKCWGVSESPNHQLKHECVVNFVGPEMFVLETSF